MDLFFDYACVIQNRLSGLLKREIDSEISDEYGSAHGRKALHRRSPWGGLGVNAIDVVHSGVSGNNGGYHTFPLNLEALPNESSW